MAPDKLTVCVRLNGIWRTFLEACQPCHIVAQFKTYAMFCFVWFSQNGRVAGKLHIFLELALLASSKNDVVPNVAVYKIPGCRNVFD